MPRFFAFSSRRSWLPFATALSSPELSESAVIDIEAHYLRIRQIFASVLTIYAVVIWFDGRFSQDRWYSDLSA
jgi:hypothetical protein